MAPSNTATILLLFTVLVSDIASPGNMPEANETAATLPQKTLKKKPGHHLGNFRLRPSITLTQQYEDNVFSADSNEVSDWVIEIAPRLKLDSTWGEHSIRLDAGASIGSYLEYDSENHKDYWAKADGRYDLSTNSNLFGGISLSRKHEGRDAEDAVLGGFEPIIYYVHSAHAGIKTKVGYTTYQFGSTFESLDFRNMGSGTSILFSDDRDRDLNSYGLRATHRLNEHFSLFAQALYLTRDYDLRSDVEGYRRDSTGYRLAVGAKRTTPDGSQVEGYVGMLTQDYDDRRFQDVEEFDFGGKATFTLGQSTKISAKLDHALNETIETASPGYLFTSLSGRLEYKISPRLIPYASAGHGRSNYLQSAREENTLSAEMGVKYFVTPYAYITTGFRHSQRDSNDAGLTAGSYDFKKNSLFLGFTLLAYPLKH